MTVYLPVWTHCTRVRFTVLLSCNDYAVHSCSVLCLQRQAAKLESGLFCYWSLLRNNNMAANFQRFTSSYSSSRLPTWLFWSQILKFWISFDGLGIFLIEKSWTKSVFFLLFFSRKDLTLKSRGGSSQLSWGGGRFRDFCNIV